MPNTTAPIMVIEVLKSIHNSFLIKITKNHYTILYCETAKIAAAGACLKRVGRVSPYTPPKKNYNFSCRISKKKSPKKYNFQVIDIIIDCP